MIDGQFGLSRPQSEPSAPLPSICEARVDLQRPLHQGYGGFDVLTEMTEGIRGQAESMSVVAAVTKSLSGTLDAFAAVLSAVVPPGNYEQTLPSPAGVKRDALPGVWLNRNPRTT